MSFDTNHLGSEMPVWAKTSPYLHSKHNNAPFDEEFYLVMNMAVGGTGIYFDKTIDGVDSGRAM
jgi:hypothetical protein